jgi:hypothetical protein
VKNNSKIHSSDLRGLLNFQEDYPECKLLLLYRGKDSLMEQGVLCMPCEMFLKKVIPNEQLF